MTRFNLVNGIVLSALLTLAGAARAATFVYVSNAEDGNIGMYALQPDGALQPGPRVDAGKPVMPMSVNGVAKDGKVSEPIQVIPTARNAHSIITDKTNRYVFVPHLGTDQIFQFRLDAKTGKLTANTPPLVQMKAGTGPRHIIMSPDNKFAYLLSELVATVTTLSLDANTGVLTEVSSASALPPGSTLVPGGPRGAVGAQIG